MRRLLVLLMCGCSDNWDIHRGRNVRHPLRGDHSGGLRVLFYEPLDLKIGDRILTDLAQRVVSYLSRASNVMR